MRRRLQGRGQDADNLLVHRGGDEADVRSHGGPLWRLLQSWPRGLYCWNEGRYGTTRLPYAVFQAVNLGVLLTTAAMSGAVGALVASLRGGEAEVGFWVGVSLAGAAWVLVFGYLLWGGLLEWLANRRQSRATSP
jgi:hypothetical protein